MDECLNDSNQEITDKYIFHKGRKIVTFPTVSGSKLYDIPSDCLSVFSIWNTTTNFQQKLRKRDENWLATQQTETNGPPVCYVRQRGWIQLSPTPDAVYTLRLFYKAWTATLVTDGDVPAIPEAWHPGVWRYARYIYWDQIRGDNAKAQWCLGVFQQWVSDKPTELQEEQQMDDTEGVIIPGLVGRVASNDFNSQTLWDRE